MTVITIMQNCNHVYLAWPILFELPAEQDLLEKDFKIVVEEWEK